MLSFLALTVSSVVNFTVSLTFTPFVLAVIITVACGANQVAHTKNTINNSTPPPIKANFLRKTLKSGIFGFFLLLFAELPGDLFLLAASGVFASLAPLLSFGFLCVESAISPTGSCPPSITSLSSTFSAGISAISGLLCNVFATGISAVAANPANTLSLVIITTLLSADLAARANSRMLTALCKTPIRRGGTKAIIRSFDDLILPIIDVISSSVSIWITSLFISNL